MFLAQTTLFTYFDSAVRCEMSFACRIYDSLLLHSATVACFIRPLINVHVLKLLDLRPKGLIHNFNGLSLENYWTHYRLHTFCDRIQNSFILKLELPTSLLHSRWRVQLHLHSLQLLIQLSAFQFLRRYHCVPTVTLILHNRLPRRRLHHFIQPQVQSR